MKRSADIYQKAFERYKELGFDPLPIWNIDGHPAKNPTEKNWPEKAASGTYVAADFAKNVNIGVLLGGTRHLTNLDLDSTEAVSVGNEVMATFMAKMVKP